MAAWALPCNNCVDGMLLTKQTGRWRCAMCDDSSAGTCRGTNYVMWQPYRPEDRTRRFRFVLQVPDMRIPLSSCVQPALDAPSQWSN